MLYSISSESAYTLALLIMSVMADTSDPAPTHTFSDLQTWKNCLESFSHHMHGSSTLD